MGRASPGPVDESEGFGGRADFPVDKSERLGRAGPAQAQPIEVRGFGVTGPGLAGPPYLANPQVLIELERYASRSASLRADKLPSCYI